MNHHHSWSPIAPEKVKEDKEKTLILIFPKQFELQRFLKAAVEEFKISVATGFPGSGETRIFYLKWPHRLGGSTIVWAIALDVSDILFVMELFKLVVSLRQILKDEEMELVVCGTCGGGDEQTIGKCLSIAQAVKFDRGYLSMQKDLPLGGPTPECLFYQPKDLGSILIAKSPMECFGERVTTFCSNHIFLDDPRMLNEMLLIGARICLVDMETFEFFSVCQAVKLLHFGAFRVISDTSVTRGVGGILLDAKLKSKLRKCSDVQFDCSCR